MAIQTTYNFKGITIPNAYIRVARIWGSSKEGWTALVEACVDETYTTPAMGTESEEGYTPETTATRKSVVESFNISAGYVSSERGYQSIYNALQAKFPDGSDV
jgi:hypothetical protein